MKILEIYKKYKIMPQLAEHMLGVAGVAEVILDNLPFVLDREDILTACLLHDVGNLIKFDLSQTGKINRNADIKRWRKIQFQFRREYGTDEHKAHLAIAREAGAGQRARELIGAISFLGAPKNAEGGDWGKKICQYSDDRVGPFGVISLKARFMDLRRRYRHHGDNTPARDAFEQALREIEKQIFAQCKIRPEDITDESIKFIVGKLRSWKIADKQA